MGKISTLLGVVAGAALAGGLLYMKKASEEAKPSEPEADDAGIDSIPEEEKLSKQRKLKEDAMKALDELKSETKSLAEDFSRDLEKALKDVKTALTDAKESLAPQEEKVTELAEEAAEVLKEAGAEIREDIREAAGEAMDAACAAVSELSEHITKE